MEFYIELTNHILSFRLQHNLSWRKVESRDIQDSDFLTPNIYQLIKIQEIDGKINLDNREWCLNPTTSFREIPELYYKVYVKRLIKPLTPSKDQLVSVILQGDDRINNSLILNVYGLFELRDFSTLNIPTEDPTIVLRQETFSAGNGYVGRDASNDRRLINELYANSLAYWRIHLEVGRTNMYCDSQADKSIDELLVEIQNLHI